MVREARIQTALARSDVPVPRIVLVDDGDLIGASCYVMEGVTGHVVRDQMPPTFAETAEERRKLAFAFLDTRRCPKHSICGSRFRRWRWD
jgi:aminoglycoside phosphotransferase (APT) family kinase protein